MTARALRIVVVTLAVGSPLLVAQGPAPQPVQWKVVRAERGAGGASTFRVELAGSVTPGWHVYAQQEPENGPIPLRVAVEDSSRAEIIGTIGGTAPTRRTDPSFELETEVYLSDFTLVVPVRWKHEPDTGGPIVLNVRYQACNDHTCLPPRTVHLSVPPS
ncbi:Disulphide bond corrector protein DsbC [Bryocella elongata]|uniref:Disulphide bond corrector protein DsbC n=1 Tax=Bryocella elongata TaxID=863522 RepID=A0A1H5Z4Q7_9BACT|nr:protein-disulfide reductase DsbD domain-containing protein [Bryocella elongata]SEG31164.1 Disulphide bond corrector protein DsbC [Bryocella elongata]